MAMAAMWPTVLAWLYQRDAEQPRSPPRDAAEGPARAADADGPRDSTRQAERAMTRTPGRLWSTGLRTSTYVPLLLAICSQSGSRERKREEKQRMSNISVRSDGGSRPGPANPSDHKANARSKRRPAFTRSSFGKCPMQMIFMIWCLLSAPAQAFNHNSTEVF